MISATPTVSVIIPAYNCDRYIVQAVESVLQQKDCSIEIVIIDDGSTDKTEAVLKPYDDRIRYVKQTNQGVAAARNRRTLSSWLLLPLNLISPLSTTIT